MEILVTTNGPVMELRLNRPDKKNAITVEMYAALADALERAAQDPSVLVVTIAGSEGVFTSGNDLKDFQQARAGGPDMPVFRFLRAIAGCPKIVIAGVEGLAIGIGTTMLLHCDLVLASIDASFLLPFVDLALVPEAASSLLLPRLIGRQRAARHLILAEPFDAETAYAYGLVTELVAEGEIDARLADMAARVAAKPPRPSSSPSGCCSPRTGRCRSAWPRKAGCSRSGCAPPKRPKPSPPSSRSGRRILRGRGESGALRVTDAYTCGAFSCLTNFPIISGARRVEVREVRA